MNKKVILLMMAVVSLIGISIFAIEVQKTEASGTINVNSDGSIDPPTPLISTTDNITYTLTDDINDSIMIWRSNITIEGAGHILNGTTGGLYVGLKVEGYGAINVTIKNVNIIGFQVGVALVSTDQNKIFDCNITQNTHGIQGLETMNNTISGNHIKNNTYGIYFNTGYFNDVFDNNITDNDNGVWLEWSENNRFYHNHFIDNINQTYVEQGYTNSWDNGYPSGGNYWSDFEERYPGVEDNYSGPGQNETGSDGFWDGPYEINGDNIDHYPIVPEFPSTILLLLFMAATSAAVVVRARNN